jgi:hypothetical protein
MASIASLPTIAFVLAYAAFDTNAGVLTALARSLTIAALLALAAALATRLAREVLFIGTYRRLALSEGASDLDTSHETRLGCPPL